MAVEKSLDLKEVLKECLLLITSSEVNKRKKLCQDMAWVIDHADAQEGHLKGIVMIISHTLHRYQDKASRNAVLNLVKKILAKDGEKLAGVLIQMVRQAAQSLRKVLDAPEPAIVVLSWCQAIHGHQSVTSQHPQFSKLVEAECICMSAAFSADDVRSKRVRRNCVKIVESIFNKDAALCQSYLDVILKINMPDLQCMTGLIFDHLSQAKIMDSVGSDKKKSLVDMFANLCLQTKVAVAGHSLDNSRQFLKFVSHGEFKELIPIIQRVLLRNPETVMQAIAYLIKGLSIDLSQYAEQLAKLVASHLRSQDEKLRTESVNALAYLAKQCSDMEALETVLKHLVKILGGSEGKLTLPEQRIAVLTAIELSAKNSVTGSLNNQTLGKTVFESLAPLLLNETHEAALLQLLSTLKTWIKFIDTELPKSFNDAIKKGISLKSSTPIVRALYFQIASEAIKGNTLMQGVPLLDTLVQSIEKSRVQSHLSGNVLETLSASTLVLRLSSLDDVQNSHGATLKQLLDSILDPVKRPLCSEKFLTTASDSDLETLLGFMSLLFNFHSEQLDTTTIKPWYQAFVTLLLRSNHVLHKQAKSLLSKTIASGSYDVLDFQTSLFTELEPEVAGDEQTETSLKRIADAYHYIATCAKEVNQSNPETLEHLLLPCHHPNLVSFEPGLWTKIGRHLDLDVPAIVASKGQAFAEMFLNADRLTESNLNALRTLLSLCASDLTPLLLFEVQNKLSNNALTQVSDNDFAIMNSPEGELYDQSIIVAVRSMQKANATVNVKGSTIQDQKEDLEYRKKRGIEEKLVFTKKQEEDLAATQAMENEIRNRLTALQANLVCNAQILDVLVETVDAEHIVEYVSALIEVLLGLKSSPLAAPVAMPVYLKLSRVVFRNELRFVGDLIGAATLRQSNTKYTLSSEWTAEDANHQIVRTLNILYAFNYERNVYTMMTYTRKRPFSAPGFAYCLPLLKSVMRNRGALIKHDEQLRMKALQVMMVHSKLRSDLSNTSGFDENVPDLLPLHDMLHILSEVIVACDGHSKDLKIQQYANTVFMETCKAASGGMGCAVAGSAEIELLLSNLLSSCWLLRNASLKGLLEIIDVLPDQETATWDTLARRVLISRYDCKEENAQLAEMIWDQADLTIKQGLAYELLEDIVHPLQDVRTSACSALAAALQEHTAIADDILVQLIGKYMKLTQIPTPVIDNLGRTISPPFMDPYESRMGVGNAIKEASEYISDTEVETLFRFYVPTGLGDRNEAVRKAMLDAAMQGIIKHGQNFMNVLLGVFEEYLDKSPDSSAQDAIRQSVIIIMGSLAKHLEKTDPKIKPIFTKLMGALSTPSQAVQQAVAACLPPLCGAIKGEAAERIKELLDLLMDSESYGERRGAAYGLSGIVKGLGILVLKQHSIIALLTERIQDKKVWRHREGALFAFETLCTMLGRLFEPYVVHLLPHLLLCFGDGNQYVREAADETAKAVMKNLSAHGVKLVLPSLLKALEEDSWRTKTGSVELLGAMSFCAPKQLSSCLPAIVPRLTEVLADSHIKVQRAGQQALQQIGGVIRNPEIQEISAIILDALADPASKTVQCLQALLSTSFVHFIDAPSLALIMPTLQNALGQRPTETKKMAAQILGNMYALTDPKDLSPYLPAVVPGLKKSLLDPSPEVRAVSGRALGATVKGMGEECYNDLMPWLLETLTTENSSVDRSGAAQGLAEVLHALGSERLDKLMPDVISTTHKVDLAPNIRDGYLMLYIYLPATFGDDFLSYIPSIIPPILQGLADESEYVRETSLKAGQRIISMYADSAIELLLPELEAGLFDEHWRIRYSSVQLLGDLLFKISGVTGKMTTMGDEDDNFGTAHQSQAITDILGVERRNRVLAGLYMGRSDVALMVRQASLHVWKVIVQNTARTLRDIMPTLFSLLLSALASKNYDKRQVAARTLGDLVRKLGERVLPEIIPILERGMDSERGDERQGVCIGLREIMDNTSRETVFSFEESLINTVRRALVDPLAEVRLAASHTFENLHNSIGHKALEGILPSVFQKLDDPLESEYALDGLKQVMAVKSKAVLPFLVPRLTTPPVNTKALAILSSVAGEALVRHLEKILPAMIKAVNDATTDEDTELELEGTRQLILTVEDEIGVRVVIDELMSAAKNQLPGIRKVAAMLLATFCKSTSTDYSGYILVLMQRIIQLMNDVDADVCKEAWTALESLVKHLDPAEQLMHLSSLRQSIKFVKDEVRNGLIPGFCILKKGITPILPIFREGILNGSQDMKEHAATGLGEVIQLTSAEALKPSVVHITGPLIRILGDRFNASVKVAILDTLGLLLLKVGIMLKPFLPQLQTTFIKAINDSTQSVRQKAAWALGLLTVLHTRVDSLFTELRNGLKNNDDNAIRETILQALRRITLNAGKKMSEAVRKGLLETLLQMISADEDGIRINAGAALGAMCQVLTDDEMKELLDDHLLDSRQSLDWTVLHGRCVTLSYGLFDASSRLFQLATEEQIVEASIQYTNNDRVPITTFGVHCLGHLLIHSVEQPLETTNILTNMAKCLQNTSNDVRTAVLQTLNHISRRCPQLFTVDNLRLIIVELVSAVKDRNTAVRCLAEITLAFTLQMDKNDQMYLEWFEMQQIANTLQEYKRITFPKLQDTLALDKDDYIFIT